MQRFISLFGFSLNLCLFGIQAFVFHLAETLHCCAFPSSAQTSVLTVVPSLHWAVEAQLVVLRGREELLSFQFPRGSEFQAAVGPCPAASLVWRRPEGQRQGSLWHWIICTSVTVPAGEGCSRLRVCVCVSLRVRVCVHMKYIYAGICSEHIFLSQGLIFICCVSTQWRCSAKKLTQVILARPSKETPP